jgi:hypothetical protein
MLLKRPANAGIEPHAMGRPRGSLRRERRRNLHEIRVHYGFLHSAIIKREGNFKLTYARTEFYDRGLPPDVAGIIP